MQARVPGRPRSVSGRRGGPGRRSSPGPEQLLLAPGLSPDAVARLLAPYGFTDPKRADANLQAMAGEPATRERLARIVAELLESVGRTADPDLALDSWERLVQAGVNRSQLYDYLRDAPRILHLLCTILGNSPALAQTLIRDPYLIYWLGEEEVLTRRPSRDQMAQALNGLLANVSAIELKLEALRRYKRREMLRVAVRDLLGLTGVRETTVALTDLAAVLIQAAYECVDAELRRRHGIPMHRDGYGRLVKTGFAVIAMGKLGGGELNYSSDVDLIYVYASDEGRTYPASRAATAISNEEYFEYLGRELTRALGEATQEGYVFRVDLRLRAEGSVGRLARPLASYERYYRSRGQVWERLALLKAWPIAGDAAVGKTFLRQVRPFIFQRPDGEAGVRAERAVLDEVKAVKEMIDGKMADRGHQQRNVKLGTGGIREIEFLVQTVQVLCGKALPGIVSRNTLDSLARFKRKGLLSAAQHDRLVRAYLFLRDVEHKLQMVHDLQTHALPDQEDEMARCGIRLGYRARDRRAMMRRFAADFARHTGIVHRAFVSLFYKPERSSLLKRALKSG